MDPRKGKTTTPDLVKLDGSNVSSSTTSDDSNSSDTDSSSEISTSGSVEQDKKPDVKVPARRGRPPKSASQVVDRKRKMVGRSASSSTTVSDADNGAKKQPLSKKMNTSGGRSTRGTDPSSKGGRTLRSREKQPKLEQKKLEFKCSQCKKGFTSKGSVNRHVRWCKPRKPKPPSKTQVNSTVVDDEGKLVTTKPGAKRGRPPKIKPVSDEQNDSRSDNKSNLSEPSCTSNNVQSNIIPPAVNGEMDSTQSTKIEPEPLPQPSTCEVNDVADTTENKPVRCTRCKNTYRTGISYRKHLNNCTYYNSSSGEDEEVEEGSHIAVVDEVPALIRNEAVLSNQSAINITLNESQPSNSVCTSNVLSADSSSTDTDTEDDEREADYDNSVLLGQRRWTETGLPRSESLNDSDVQVDTSTTRVSSVTSLSGDLTLKPIGTSDSPSSPLLVPSSDDFKPMQSHETESNPHQSPPEIAIEEINESKMPHELQVISTPAPTQTHYATNASSDFVESEQLNVSTLPVTIVQEENCQVTPKIAHLQYSPARSFINDGLDQRQMQEIFTQFQNNKDFTIQIKDSNVQIPENVQPSVIPDQDISRNTFLPNQREMSYSNFPTQETETPPENRYTSVSYNPASVVQTPMTYSQQQQFQELESSQIHKWSRNTQQQHHLNTSMEIRPDVELEVQLKHGAGQTIQHCQYVPDLQDPSPQLRTVTLQDSRGQLVTVQIPINVDSSQNSIQECQDISPSQSAPQTSVQQLSQIQQLQIEQFQQQQIAAATIQQQLQQQQLQRSIIYHKSQENAFQNQALFRDQELAIHQRHAAAELQQVALQQPTTIQQQQETRTLHQRQAAMEQRQQSEVVQQNEVVLMQLAAQQQHQEFKVQQQQKAAAEQHQYRVLTEQQQAGILQLQHSEIQQQQTALPQQVSLHQQHHNAIQEQHALIQQQRHVERDQLRQAEIQHHEETIIQPHVTFQQQQHADNELQQTAFQLRNQATAQQQQQAVLQQHQLVLQQHQAQVQQQLQQQHQTQLQQQHQTQLQQHHQAQLQLQHQAQLQQQHQTQLQQQYQAQIQQHQTQLQQQHQAQIQQQHQTQLQQQHQARLQQEQQDALQHQQVLNYQRQPNLSFSSPNREGSCETNNTFSASETPDNNVTYFVVQQGNTLSTLPISRGSNSTIAPFQVGIEQQHDPQRMTENILTGTLDDPSNHCKFQLNGAQTLAPLPLNQFHAQCTTSSNGQVSPVGSVMSTTGANSSPARPCPCPDCHQRVCQGSAGAVDKVKVNPVSRKFSKQLGYSSWEQIQPISSLVSSFKRAKSLKVRSQLASIVSERQGQGLLLYKTMTSPSPGPLPRLLPATVVTSASVSTRPGPSSARGTVNPGTTDSIYFPIVTPSLVPEKTATPNPNIAVVHPLQKMSNQILQMESTFSITPTAPNLIPENWVHPNESNSPANSSAKLAQQLADIQATLSARSEIPMSSPEPVPQLLCTQIPVDQQSSSQGLDMPPLVVPAKDIPVATEGTKTSDRDKDSSILTRANTEASLSTTPTSPYKRKLESSEPGTEPKPPSQKSIKVTLKRQEGGDSYSLLNISETGNQAPGTMRSLKIKGKITSGEQAGNTTDVVVLPVVHTIPIPDPDAQESNRTITEEDCGSKSGTTGSALMPAQMNMRLTHRAVIVYEVRLNDTVVFRSSDVRSVWGNIFETVQGRRLNHNLPPLAYPATNISLPENSRDAAASFNQLGLTHRAVQFLLEQLPGINKAAKEKQVFKFHKPLNTSMDDPSDSESSTGSARSRGYTGRKPFDMFGWLASKHREPLVLEKKTRSFDTSKSTELPLAMKFRNLNKHRNEHLIVYCSSIHGRGLFTTKDIECGDMIIEYAGEIIRSVICDFRDRFYESRGIGCYMFRIDDHLVVDATLKGNSARFINHSCNPNCHTKVMEISGKKHIVVISLRRIKSGEELTYDYKFPYEDKKIPCSCDASKCRKFLN